MPSDPGTFAIRLAIKRVSHWPAWPWWSVAVVVFWLGLVWATHRALPGTPTCAFKRVVGVPCPTCGLTRGVTSIVERGDVVGGVAYNPFVMIAGLLALLVLGVRLAAGRQPAVAMTRTERRVAVGAFVVLFLANWAYLIAYVG